jgi:DNA-binding transcriptional ArsR family regulator
MAQSYRHPHIDEIELHEVFRALGDPIRLNIATILLDLDETLCAPLAAQLGIADSTLSHHLRQMREAGITWTRPDGVHRWTSLRRDDLDRRFPGFVDWLKRTLADQRRAKEHEAKEHRAKEHGAKE